MILSELAWGGGGRRGRLPEGVRARHFPSTPNLAGWGFLAIPSEQGGLPYLVDLICLICLTGRRLMILVFTYLVRTTLVGTFS